MKKFVFLMVLSFPVLSLFAQNAASYEKLLKGDLSDFAGYWVNGEGDRMYLRPDGTTHFQGLQAGGFKKSSNGTYWWNVYGDDVGAWAVTILPVGVEGFYDVQTDTTKVRLIAGHDAPGSAAGYYYRETAFPATHTTTENLKLRTDQGLSASTITVLSKGTRVLLQRWGDEITVDGVSAMWVYVFTPDGLEGWCFSAYLRDTRVQ
ncbi:MAG: SH3 domain-containing protein [Spirochaetaceae bacterium]|jgi:hypothetical protein|nr:SH3 domain-containing protein [Spirochaetaceae bacterium]